MWTSLIVRVEPIIFMVQEFCRVCTPGRKGDLGGHRNMLLNSETCSHTALHDHFPPDSGETQSPCHDLPGYLCEIIFLNSSTMSVTIHHRPKSYYIFDAVFLSCPLQFVPFLCSSKKPSKTPFQGICAFGSLCLACPSQDDRVAHALILKPLLKGHLSRMSLPYQPRYNFNTLK